MPGAQQEKRAEVINSSPLWITRRAFDVLRQKLEAVAADITEYAYEAGKAGEGGEWHENFAFEDYHRKHEAALAEQARLKNIQSRVEVGGILPPRIETDTVELGNDVVIRFEGEKKPERYSIVTFEDRLILEDRSVLSIESPLGRLLIGAQLGQKIRYTVNDYEKVQTTSTVEVLQIHPRNFE